MTFEVFKKGSAPVPSVPSVTIQKRGLFSLNEAASALVNHPRAIRFLWDQERNLIALEPVALEDPDAYPLRQQGGGRAKTGRHGPLLAAGTLFSKHVGLDTSAARRWVPKLVDGMLIIDLNTPGQVVIANRNRRKNVAAVHDSLND